VTRDLFLVGTYLQILLINRESCSLAYRVYTLVWNGVGLPTVVRMSAAAGSQIKYVHTIALGSQGHRHKLLCNVSKAIGLTDISTVRIRIRYKFKNRKRLRAFCNFIDFRQYRIQRTRASALDIFYIAILHHLQCAGSRT
jgi:hypothetical protein